MKNQPQKNKPQESWEEIAHVVWNAENEYHAKKILEDLGSRLLKEEREKVIKEIEKRMMDEIGFDSVKEQKILNKVYEILNALTKE